jgi:hypothetical protein
MHVLWGTIGVLTFTLSGPRDRLGAALVLVPYSAGSSLRVEWERLDRWGPAERWCDIWFLFGSEPDRVHPAFYVRPDTAGKWEWGWSNGPDPEDQCILGDEPGQAFIDPCAGRATIAADGEGLHITDAAGDVLRFEREIFWQIGWPPRYVGIYNEASEHRVTITAQAAGMRLGVPQAPLQDGRRRFGGPPHGRRVNRRVCDTLAKQLTVAGPRSCPTGPKQHNTAKEIDR